jgi:hypothetical protein
MTWTSYNPISQMPKFYANLYDDDTIIPTTDEVAWGFHTEFRRVYNKMHICWTQGIPFGPVGTMPTEYPVCVKPIYNLLGGSVKSQVCHNEQEYLQIKDPSLFWSRYHMGDHLSIDFIVLDGVIQDAFVFRGEKLQHGAFDYWELMSKDKHYFEYRIAHVWIESNLKGYTGCVNVEAIGGNIIEVQLRMGDLDRLGNITLMQSIHTLYSQKRWDWVEDQDMPDTFYLAALFAQPNTTFSFNPNLIGKICEDLTYYQIDDTKQYHINPSHGNRVAIFCDENWEAVARARNIVAALFKPDIDGRYLDCLRDYEELRL